MVACPRRSLARLFLLVRTWRLVLSVLASGCRPSASASASDPSLSVVGERVAEELDVPSESADERPARVPPSPIPPAPAESSALGLLGGRRRPDWPFAGRVPSVSARVHSVEAAGVDPAAVRVWLRAHINEVRDCYQDARAILYGAFGGEAAIAWVIDPRGRVRKLRLVDATPETTDIGNCVIARMSRWRFPQPLWQYTSPRANARVTVVLSFRPP